MQARLTGLDPGHPEPELPHDEYTCRYDLSISPECIVEHWEYDLCRTRFLGDAFPTVKPFFGAGAAAAFLGADIHNTEHTSCSCRRKSRKSPTSTSPIFRTIPGSSKTPKNTEKH